MAQQVKATKLEDTSSVLGPTLKARIYACKLPSDNGFTYTKQINCFLKESSRLAGCGGAHAFNPNTQKAEAGRALWGRHQPGLQNIVPGQLGLLNRETISKKKKKSFILNYVYAHVEAQGSRECFRFPEVRAQAVISCLMWVLGTKLGPVQA